MPDLEPRPWAYCHECGEDVQARQTWKDTSLTRTHGKIGKFRSQYVYTCPNTLRRHESFVVEPYVVPAAAVIDWADVGTRIGDRKRPLEPTTMGKIRAGLARVAEGPTIIQVNHAGHGGRHYPA